MDSSGSANGDESRGSGAVTKVKSEAKGTINVGTQVKEVNEGRVLEEDVGSSGTAHDKESKDV